MTDPPLDAKKILAEHLRDREWIEDVAERRSRANTILLDALGLRDQAETPTDRLARIERAVRAATHALWKPDPPPVRQDARGRWLWEHQCLRCAGKFVGTGTLCDRCEAQIERWVIQPAGCGSMVTACSYPWQQSCEGIELHVPKDSPKEKAWMAKQLRWLADALEGKSAAG